MPHQIFQGSRCDAVLRTMARNPRCGCAKWAQCKIRVATPPKPKQPSEAIACLQSCMRPGGTVCSSRALILSTASFCNHELTSSRPWLCACRRRAGRRFGSAGHASCSWTGRHACCCATCRHAPRSPARALSCSDSNSHPCSRTPSQHCLWHSQPQHRS